MDRRMGKKTTYTCKTLNFFNVIFEHGWLLALVVAIKLGNVVDLDVVLDAVAQTV